MIEINDKTKNNIDLKLVKDISQKFLNLYKQKNKQVSIAFVGDKTIKKLNRIYRGVDKPTDVLAFPEGNSLETKNKYLGEIIIDYAQIKRQAKLFSSNIKEELIFILVHGLLHLLGYSDKTKKGKEEMDKLGKEFIINLNYDKNKKII